MTGPPPDPLADYMPQGPPPDPPRPISDDELPAALRQEVADMEAERDRIAEPTSVPSRSLEEPGEADAFAQRMENGAPPT